MWEKNKHKERVIKDSEIQTKVDKEETEWNWKERWMTEQTN